MAFSTPFSTKTEPARVWGLWGGVLLCLFAVYAVAQGLKVISAEIVASEDEYFLNADFDISLGSAVESALNKGVPLTFIVEAQLTRPRWYWFDESVVDMSRVAEKVGLERTHLYRKLKQLGVRVSKRVEE